jgi:hypothetical protein
MIDMPQLAMAASRSGITMLDPQASEYEYLQELKPLVNRWGDIVGRAIVAAAEKAQQFSPNDVDETDEEAQAAVDAYERVFNTTGCDVVCGVFALGYLLGDPRWDTRVHDYKTFQAALNEDRDNLKVLTTRFRGEYFLRDRFNTGIATGAQALTMAFRTLDLPHNRKNVHEWGKLSMSYSFFEAFQLGLKSRRIWEEDVTFNEIANQLES